MRGKSENKQILITIKQTGSINNDPPQNAVLNTLYMILHGYGIPISFLKPFVYPQVQEKKILFIKTTKTIKHELYHRQFIINIKGDLLSPYVWSIGIGKRELVRNTINNLRLKSIPDRHGEELSNAIIDFTSALNDYNKLLYIIGEIPTRNTYDILVQGLKQWKPEWMNINEIVTIPTKQDIYKYVEKLEYDETKIFIDGQEPSEAGKKNKPETEYLALITNEQIITLLYICNLPRKLVMTEPLIQKELDSITRVQDLSLVKETTEEKEDVGDKTE